MSKKKRRRHWHFGVLRRRGWTRKLVAELLPKPLVIHTERGTTQLWKPADVMQAEADPRFPGLPPALSTDEGRAGQFLREAWEAVERDDSLPWLLAERYHQGILAYLHTAAAEEAPYLRAAHAAAVVKDFLGLERRCQSKALPERFQKFLRIAPCLGAEVTGVSRKALGEHYPLVLHAAAAQAAADFMAAQPEAHLRDMLSQPGFPHRMLLREGLGAVWSVWYVPQAIRSSLSLLLALNPKDEYPQARAMRRHFILHLGGTNTGKTYAGFQRLIQARNGVYLGPLRLLALEAQDALLEAGVACSLCTGEEEDRREGDTHVASTAEKLDLEEPYDVAVIDECQMITDPQRGYAWTRAILGVLSPEVHLCAAPQARQILLRLIDSCGDSWEIQEHRRTTPLICMSRTMDFDQVQPGDALISFSKVGVLSTAEDLRMSGKEPAIIYGALPHSTRRRQMQGFLEGQMEYVVATDAIGMGLNLPIRRIIFLETEKFDGVERRGLKPEEIQQIAGRAGRYGMYDRGYVGATENLSAIQAGLDTVVPPLQYAVVGFSDLVLQVDFDLLEVLTEWSKMPAVEPYRKLDISRYLFIITKLREKGFQLSREQELRAANIPFSEAEPALLELFFDFLAAFVQGLEVNQPAFPEEKERTLPELELYYRKLDLYYSFARTFDCPVDDDALYDGREQTADEINEILLHRLRSNIRFCALCGKPMPRHHRGRLCTECHRKRGNAPRSGASQDAGFPGRPV